MSGLPRAALALLGVGGLIAAVAWVPASANAQESGPGNITITSAGPDGTGNPYDLTVVADDANNADLTAMTVHLSGPINYTISDMQPADDGSDFSSQAWAPSSVIPTTDLPAGTYQITVDATDQHGETDTGIPAGSIQYSDSATSISVNPSQPTVTWGFSDVTFSGSVTGTASYDGTTGVPIAGATVNVSENGSLVTQVTTAADGSYSYGPVSLPGTTDFDFAVQAAGDGTYPGQDPGPVTITASPASPTNVQATLSSLSYSGGSESLTFTGSATVTSASTPLADVPVDLTTDGGSNPQGAVTTTDSDGNFSYTVNNVTSPTDYDFSVSGGLYAAGDADVDLDSSATSVQVAANPPQVSWDDGGPDPVTISGTVTIAPSAGPAVAPAGIPIDLSINGGPVMDAVTQTQSGGTFTYGPVTDITSDTTYTFTADAPGFSGPGDSATVDVAPYAPAGSTQIAISSSPSSAQVTEGATAVNLTATVTTIAPGSGGPGTNAGPNIPVDVNGTPIGTTNASGQVTFQATAGDYSFTVPSPNPSDPTDALYAPASAAETVTAAPATTVIDVTPPQVITFGNPTTTISGSVMAQQPPIFPSPQSVPVTDVPIYVDGASTSSTTQNDGSFTYTTPALTAPKTDYDFTVPPSGANLYSEGDSGPVEVDVDAGQTDLTVTQATTGPNTETFSCAVQIAPGGPTQTADFGDGGPSVPIDLSINGGAATQVGETDSSGTLTYGPVSVTPGATYTFSVPTNPLYAGASQDVSPGVETTSMQITPSQTFVTEGSQDVTFTGTVQVTPLGSTSPQNLDQVVPVDLSINGGPVQDGVTQTNSSGQFTYTASGISADTKYAFSVPASSEYAEGSQTVPVSLNPAGTRITRVSLSPTKVKYGQKTTLTGTVQYQSASSAWTPLSHSKVDIAEGTTSLGTVTTGANGSFTATLPSTHGFGWSATVAAATLTAGTQAAGNLVISVPMKVKSFGASLGVTGNVGLHGCLEVTAPVGYGPVTTVAVQYSSNGRNGWKTLGRLALHNLDRTVKSCPAADESYFSGSIAAKADNAYYRADFAASNSFQGAVSGVIHSWRYQTKITGYAVSVRSITQNQRFTISGRLWWHGPKGWVAYAHQKVDYIYHENGTTFWGTLGSSKTNSKGYFSEVAAGGTGSFAVVLYAQYPGSSVNLAARSRGITVTNKVSTASIVRGDMSVQLATSTAQKDTLAREEYLIVDSPKTKLRVL
jgi:large repetitive protein